MSTDVKRKYLDCVYDIIKNEGIENVSIRRIAKEVGSNSATLYRYFDSVEYLICLAAVRYLEPYLQDIKELNYMSKDLLEQNFKLWERFCRYSFTDPEIFEMLFFGKYKDKLMDIMFEYYDIYKSGFLELDAFSINFLFTADIFERNFMFFKRAVNQNLIDQKTAEQISNFQVYAYHGMLSECIIEHYTGDALEAKIQEFIGYNDMILEMLYKNK